jgi:peptidoglycan/xylan/chitin deacetylase (PgdA/CDA1 family)
MLPMNPWLIAGPTGLAAVAAGIAAYGAAYPRSQLFGRTVCRTNAPQKLALTFDDGPNPRITPKLLDLLDRYKARATFFYSIIAATGAPPRWLRPPFGTRNPWVVPVARELNQRVVMWTLIPGDWRATSSEWLIPRIEPIATRAQRNLSAAGAAGGGATTGDILCLHDGSHRQLNADRLPTLAALEHWLPRWRDLGLEFVTIDDAVSRPAT